MSDHAPIRSPTRRRLLKTLGLSGAGGLAGLVTVNELAPLVAPEEPVFETNHSYWSLALPAANPPLSSDLKVDVAIIGGGFTGLSAAYYLSKTLPGKRIALFEARGCGNGASGRNGAMVLNTKNTTAQPTVARRLYELTLDNIHAIQSLATSLGIDCELEHHGALTVMSQADEVSAARADLATLRAAGIPLEFWGREQLASTIGSSVYEGAVFDPGAGQVHPGKLVRLWKAAAAEAGVRIYEHTPIKSIHEGPVHELITQDGRSIRAPLLVLATNAYTSKLGYLRGAVAPISNYVGMTPILDQARLDAVGWKTLIPFNDSRREVYYAGLTADRRIHFGGGPVDYAFNDGMRNPREAAQRHAALHREFERVFPSLADVPFEMTWSGFVDVSLDQTPAVGRLGRHGNVFYGIGYSGEGVNLTSVFGRVIADLAAGQAARWSWFPYLNRSLLYIPNEPFRWLAIKADIAYTRLRSA